jgi:MFS family permease
MPNFNSGYDEGGYSASVTLESFMDDFNLNQSHWKNDANGLANRKANVGSFMVLGAALGCLLAIVINDYAGRLRAWQVSVVIYVTGSLIQIFSSGIYGLLLFARIWAGFGAGALTVIAPLYLSEIAPARTRGLIVSIYMVILLLIQALGGRLPSPCFQCLAKPLVKKKREREREE